MSHSVSSLHAYNPIGYHQAPHNQERPDHPLEDWQMRQTHIAYGEPLSSTLKRMGLYPLSYLQTSNQDLIRLSQDNCYATRPASKQRQRTGWMNSPVEIQLKILGFLNEIIKQENPSLKRQDHNRFPIPVRRRAILSRGFLAPLTLVSKSFAGLVNVFKWQALNLGVASVPETLAIEKRLKGSDQVGRHVHSLSMWWYEPQYNNIWAGWYEEPVYEAGLNILSSITKLISLELILNTSPPQYCARPLTERVKTLGRELMSNLRSFRLLTTRRVRQSEEELVVCMIEAAQQLKRFECHSGPIAMGRQHDQSLRSESLSSVSTCPLSSQVRRLPNILASLYELESLAVSCGGCLSPDWVSIEWKSKVRQLSVSDFAYRNWKIGSAFIKQFANSLVHLELISDRGILSGPWNEADTISLPHLESLKLRMRSTDREDGYLRFLGLFSTCPKIHHFELFEQRLSADGSIQASSMMNGLEVWPKLKSVKLVLNSLPTCQVTHQEIEQIRISLNRKNVDFQLHTLQ